MIRVSVRVSGTFAERQEQARRRIGEMIQAGLKAAGEELLAQSQALTMVPRDTHTLAESGRATMVGEGLDSESVVGYGGSDLPPQTRWSSGERRLVTRKASEYALRVHEDETQRYPSGITQYLRNPADTKHEEMRQALHQGIKGV